MTNLSRIRQKMKEKSIDALFITGDENILYLSDFSFSDGALLILTDIAFLLTDFRYAEAARAAAKQDFAVVTPPSLLAFAEEVLTAHGVTHMGYEDADLSASRYFRYRDLFSCEMCPFSAEISALRAAKSADEVRRIKEAQRLTDMAFSHILSYLRPGLTETDVALELEFFMRKNGALRTSFDTIAVSGRASALPHGGPRRVPLENGSLTMDFGCVVDGYCSDMTRTVVIGKATPEERKVYHTVLSAQENALAAIRAGVTCASIDAIARQTIDCAGYKGAFGHGLGHGVGLFIHEAPRLSPSAGAALLESGNVVTVEPGIYLEGKYGCRIEDMVLVTETGFENLSHSTKELIEIG